MRNKVIVVEGKNDKEKIKSLYKDIHVITTNGSSIDLDSINLLKELSKTHDIVLFTDPDHAGERIRRILAKELDHIYHAFIDKEKSISSNHKKIGVEHASAETIKNALNHLMLVQTKSTSDITYSFLYEHNLIGNEFSKEKREKLAKKMNIGHVNGKTLYQRLHMFNLNKKDVLEVLNS
jgi:ribonuclease M5